MIGLLSWTHGLCMLNFEGYRGFFSKKTEPWCFCWQSIRKWNSLKLEIYHMDIQHMTLILKSQTIIHRICWRSMILEIPIHSADYTNIFAWCIVKCQKRRNNAELRTPNKFTYHSRLLDGQFVVGSFPPMFGGKNNKIFETTSNEDEYLKDHDSLLNPQTTLLKSI